MLSKKQEKIFFLGGTFVFLGIFLGLSYHTVIVALPEHTDLPGLTETVVKGKRIWEAENCMGCHTILGEGAYYAPELTKVVERRGDGYIIAVLKATKDNPWAPNKRKMVGYGFSDEEANALLEFFKWIGRSDLNGFPPKPKFKN